MTPSQFIKAQAEGRSKVDSSSSTCLGLIGIDMGGLTDMAFYLLISFTGEHVAYSNIV